MIIVKKDSSRMPKQLFHACSVDFGYRGNFKPVDVLADPDYTDLASNGFTGMNFSGISTSDRAHMVRSGGSAYNCNPPCPEWDGGKQWTKDFVDEFFQFCDKAGITKGYIANVQNGMVDEVFAAIDRGATIIIYGGEQNLEENESFWFEGGKSYKEKIDGWITQVNEKYPGIVYHIVDAAPSWYNASRINREWNDDAKGITGDAARMYLWADDLCDCRTLSSISNAFTNVLPEWMDKFDDHYPDHDIAVVQLGWKQSDEKINTFLNCDYIFEAYHFMLSNADFGFASFQTLKSLSSFENNRQLIRIFGKLFAKENLLTNTIDYPNMKAVTGESEGKYVTLVKNNGATSQTISLKRNGSKQEVNFEFHSFQAPDSTYRTVTTGVGKNITIPAYCFGMLTY